MRVPGFYDEEHDRLAAARPGVTHASFYVSLFVSLYVSLYFYDEEHDRMAAARPGVTQTDRESERRGRGWGG